MDGTIDEDNCGISSPDRAKGGRELRVSRDHGADDEAVAARSAVETLARALREAGAIREASEEALRRATTDAEEGAREAKEGAAAAAAATAAAEAAQEATAAAAAAALAEAAAAAEEAGQRYAADLAGVARERDALREKCAGLRARLAESEVWRATGKLIACVV